jgi:hypothetical protein
LANEHLGLRIGFRNDTTGELAEIVWRVRFGGAWVDSEIEDRLRQA